MIMDYLATYPEGTLHLYSSDIILTLESYSAYLVLHQSLQSSQPLGTYPAKTQPQSQTPYD